MSTEHKDPLDVVEQAGRLLKLAVSIAWMLVLSAFIGAALCAVVLRNVDYFWH